MNQKNLATTSRFPAWKTQCEYRRRSRKTSVRIAFRDSREICQIQPARKSGLALGIGFLRGRFSAQNWTSKRLNDAVLCQLILSNQDVALVRPQTPYLKTEFYRQIVEEYPNSPYTNQAKTELEKSALDIHPSLCFALLPLTVGFRIVFLRGGFSVSKLAF